LKAGNHGTLVDIQWRVYSRTRRRRVQFKALSGEHGTVPIIRAQCRYHRCKRSSATRSSIPAPDCRFHQPPRRNQPHRAASSSHLPPEKMQPHSIDTLAKFLPKTGPLRPGGYGNRELQERHGPPRIDTYATTTDVRRYSDWSGDGSPRDVLTGVSGFDSSISISGVGPGRLSALLPRDPRHHHWKRCSKTWPFTISPRARLYGPAGSFIIPSTSIRPI